MRHLVELTQREPLLSSASRRYVEIKNMTDWNSLLEFWYQVRCLVMHGSEVQPSYVYLAYQTLYIFMDQIVETLKLAANEDSLYTEKRLK